jgi:hypothetical protein
MVQFTFVASYQRLEPKYSFQKKYKYLKKTSYSALNGWKIVPRV